MSAKITIKGNTFESGDEVTLIYQQDAVIVHGALYFTEKTKRFWFCSNSPTFNGEMSPNMLGYLYSFSFSVSSCEFGSEYFYHRIKCERYSNPKDYINEGIISFLRKHPQFYFLFSIKNGLTELYDSLTTSEEKGMVVFHSSARNKKLAIKMGRLIRRLTTSFNEMVTANPKNNINFNVTDEEIEKIHNSYMSLNDKSLRHEIVTGSDILKGYTRSNYTDGRGTLHNSCMTDKADYLKIYTDNPDKISLAIFYDKTDKICARALVWKCDDGNTYYDRIYYTIDWQQNSCVNIFKSLNYLPIFHTSKPASVKLSKLDFLNYPYIDTFFGVSFKKKQLFYDPNGDKKIRYELRTTTGQIFERFSSNDLDFE